MKTILPSPALAQLAPDLSGQSQIRKASEIVPTARRGPAISPQLIRIFSTYSRWYVGRHFHSIRLSVAGLPPSDVALPLVIYLNHASWWDPLICLLLQNEFFAPRPAYAPIDRAALEQYKFFARLGFFGVEQNSPRGAIQFLRTATEILHHPNAILWLTPQGCFADARQRPAAFKSGLGHLPARVRRATYVPLAVEYAYWQERKPEVLCRFGPPEIISTGTPQDWTAHFEQKLAATQDALAAEALRRNPADFQTLLRSRSGVGLAYDTWRQWRARLSGRNFRPEHGRL